MSRLVSDDAVSEALNFLATKSQEIAAARGMVVRREFQRRALRARLTLDSNAPTVSAREAEAEASQAYQEACDAEADAIERDEEYRAERNKAETILRCWQTESSNNRTGGQFR